MKLLLLMTSLLMSKGDRASVTELKNSLALTTHAKYRTLLSDKVKYNSLQNIVAQEREEKETSHSFDSSQCCRQQNRITASATAH